MVDRQFFVLFFLPRRDPILKLRLRLVSGKVTRTSDHTIASGGSQDIYTGEWAGQNVRARGDEAEIFLLIPFNSRWRLRIPGTRAVQGGR